MIKAVIFDFDQVLIDSVKQIMMYYKEVFKCVGVPFPKAKDRRFLYTLVAKDIDKKFFSKIDEKEFWKCRTDVAHAPYLKYVKLNKDTKSILNYLKKQGYKMAIVTNRASTTHVLLKKFKIEKYFDSVLIGNQIKHPKPNPEPINKTIKALKIKKDEAIYVGDDIVDIKAGENAGVKVALFRNKFKGAHYYITNLKQIKKILGDING